MILNACAKFIIETRPDPGLSVGKNGAKHSSLSFLGAESAKPGGKRVGVFFGRFLIFDIVKLHIFENR